MIFLATKHPNRRDLLSVAEFVWVDLTRYLGKARVSKGRSFKSPPAVCLQDHLYECVGFGNVQLAEKHIHMMATCKMRHDMPRCPPNVSVARSAQPPIQDCRALRDNVSAWAPEGVIEYIPCPPDKKGNDHGAKVGAKGHFPRLWDPGCYDRW